MSYLPNESCHLCGGHGVLRDEAGGVCPCEECVDIGALTQGAADTGAFVQGDLVRYQAELFARAADIIKKKNDDYASPGEVFKNFDAVRALGITSTEKGFLVRMTDKMSRLSTFAERGELSVKEESVEDAIVDLINYACLLGAYIKYGRN